MNAQVTIRTNIAKVTDKTSSPDARQGVAVAEDENNSGAGYAVATDGRVMAVVPIEHKGDRVACEATNYSPARDYALIPGDVLRKPTSRRPNSVSLNGRVECNGRVGEYPDGRFPRVSQAVPAMQDRLAVSIDAKLLANLSEAINEPGNNVVTLLLSTDKTDCAAIGVLPSTETNVDSHGVLMPVAHDCRKASEFNAQAMETFNARARAYAEAMKNRIG